MAGVSIRTILVALPTVYLLVALFYMNGARGTRTSFREAPQTVVTILSNKLVGGGGAKPAPPTLNTAIHVPGDTPVHKVAEPVAVSRPLAGADEPNAPEPLDASIKSQTVKFYEGNSVTVYEHPDRGQGGALGV